MINFTHMDSSLDQLVGEDEDVMEENTSQATRGPASLDRVRKAVNLSVEFHPVTFIPLGDPGTRYTNWVGLETRTSISILLADWKKVEKVQKDHLWSAIQKHWNIPNDENTLQIKKSTLKIANTSWRNFKKNLIRKYARKGKIPFLKYKFIKEETWREFCRLKSTREFMEKSTKGKALVKLNKNPHRLGSRGYLGKKDQWAKEKELGKCPELFSLSTERACEFLLARRIKVGPDDYELPENLLPLANQIIEKERLTPGEDSLVAVMGKDHSGRTRGVSHNVGVRTTLPGLAGKKRKHEDMESLKRTMEDQEKVIKELKVSNANFEDQQKHMQEQIHVILSQQPCQNRDFFTREKNRVKGDTQVFEDANNNKEAPENVSDVEGDLNIENDVVGSDDGELNCNDTQNIAEELGTPHVEHCVEGLYNKYDGWVLSSGRPKKLTTKEENAPPHFDSYQQPPPPTAQATTSQPLPPVAPLAPPAKLSCLPQTDSDKLPAYFQIHVPGLPVLADAAENALPHFDSSQQPPPTAQAKSSQSLPPVAPSVLPAEPLSPPQTDSVELQVSSPQSGTICVQGYNVKRSVAPILEAIFKKHGDIAAECQFKTASVRSSFLEVVCEVVTRIEADDVIEKMEEVESQVSDAEAANINVAWLRAHLEAVHKRKGAMKLMETKVNTILVESAARMDLRERCEELMTAQERFEKAERCVRVLHLVRKNIENMISATKAETDLWVKRRLL